jgi:hypothetical protein
MGDEQSHSPMMTRICWRFVDILSRILDTDERQVFRGDVAESGHGVARAIWDVSDLVLRRQIGLWTVWQPWLALVGIACLTGAPLSGIAFRLNVDLGQQLMAYFRYGVHFGTLLTPQQDMAWLLCLAFALLLWSWTCGFVLGSLSGRAVWVTWSLFYLMVLDFAWVRFILSGSIILRDPQPLRILMAASLPLQPATLLFSLSSLWGAFMGVRRRVLPWRTAYVLASAITIFTILVTWMSGWYETAHEVWSSGAWHGVPWTARLWPFVVVSWPIAYLLATANRQQTASRKETT